MGTEITLEVGGLTLDRVRIHVGSTTVCFFRRRIENASILTKLTTTTSEKTMRIQDPWRWLLQASQGGRSSD